MRKIQISEYTNPDKQSLITRQRKYRVWLQSGCNFLFSSNKEMLKFLAETNRFLNQKLFQLNDLLNEVFSLYRGIWFYLDHQSDSYLSQMFRDINKSLSLSHSKTADNSRPFHFFYRVLGLYKEIINVVIDVHRQRNNWAEIHKLESLVSRIDYLEMELKNYMKNHPSFMGASLESQGLGLSFKMKVS